MRNTIRTSIIVLSSLVPSVALGSFSDVTRGHPYAEAIEWAQTMAIVQGYSDGTFHPNDTVNRAEFTKIVIGANFTPPAYRLCDPYSMYSYKDAQKDAWYSKYLCLASQHKIIQGYADGTFRPDSSINFAEAAKIIALLSTFENGVQYSHLALPKATGGAWYEVYVQHLQNKTVIPPTIQKSDQAVTRGEMVYMMFRLKNIFENTDTWKVHSDINNHFMIDFPRDWGRLNAEKGSYDAFDRIQPTVTEYGSGDGSLKAFVGYMTNSNRAPGETWGDAAMRYLSLSPQDTLVIKTNYRTYPQYNFSPNDGKGIFYEVIGSDDTAIIIGYDIPSTMSTAIKASIRFMQ